MQKPSQRISILNIIIFLLLIFTLGGLNLSKQDKPTVSILENRALQQKPNLTLDSLFKGAYSRDFDNYFADNFYLRDYFVSLSKKIADLRGLPFRDKAVIIAHQGANVFQQGGEPEEDLEESDSQVQGRVLVVEDKGMEMHKYDAAAGQLYANSLNEFAEKHREDLKVYSMLIPTQLEFFAEGKYLKLVDSQKESIARINAFFNPLVYPVNAYDVLGAHAKEYIYFRTDHHWTALGAYYAYSAFMEIQGESPIPLERYETGQLEGFLGSTYSTTLSVDLRNNPDVVVYYKPFVPHLFQAYYSGTQGVEEMILNPEIWTEQNNKYGIFLGGDKPMARITTQNKNNSKILVVKDSYGNAFVPFLLPHYEEVYVVDPRSFEGNLNELISDNEINEVLFLNYILVTDNEGFPKLLEKLVRVD